MDFRTVEYFKINEATREFLEQLDDRINEINRHRPLSDELVIKIFQEILYDRVYSSAAIEGNKLTRRETIVVLTKGIIEAGNRKDEIEISNLAAANYFLQELLDSKEELQLHDILSIHSILLNKIDDSNKGKFRNEDVTISGARYTPPFHYDVPNLMDQVIGELRKAFEMKDCKYHPIQIASWLHWSIARIHPFRDGNGRIARILQDYVLLKMNYVPSIIQIEDRDRNYYEALELADDGETRNFEELIIKNALRVADQYVSIIMKESEKNSWLKGITEAASEKVKQSQHRKYSMYISSINRLKEEFQRTIRQLEGQLPSVDIKMMDFGNFPFEKYEKICRKEKVDRLWSFGIEFRGVHASTRYIFWHGYHRISTSDIFDKSPAECSILISGDEDGYYVLLDESGEDRISLREIIPNRSTYYVRKYNPVTDRHYWDIDVDSSDIVKNFIEEALRLLGII